MRRSRHVYFYCNAFSEEVRTRRGVVTDSPAASRKVVGLCRALRAAGVPATIISMGRGAARGGAGFHPGMASRVAGIPIAYGPLSQRRGLSQLISMAWLAVMALRLVRNGNAIHLFYNQLLAYLPALAILRLCGRTSFVDIEDGPTSANEVSHHRRFSNASPRAYEWLVRGGALLACTALAQGTRIRPAMPYWGAIDAREVRAHRNEGRDLVEVLFAGFFSEETGSLLLRDAIGRLRVGDTALARRLRIHIAGIGPGFDDVAHLDGGEAPKVTVHGRLDPARFSELLEACDVGLSLKLPGRAISDTTFPSKTVEYAENGLALVTTDVSDVRLLFETNALYLDKNDPQALADLLVWCAANPAAVGELGRAGQRVVHSQLSFQGAGARLKSFFFGEDAQ